MLQQVIDTTHGEAWNKYRLDNMQIWDNIPSIIFWLDKEFTYTFTIWGKSWRHNPIYMDVSIREVRDYTYIVIKILLSFFIYFKTFI
jgi:hypothetical protein